MRIPAPSAMTKPLRPRANGREALAGSELELVVNACRISNPFIVSGRTHASAPPAITASALPARKRSRAMPMALAPEEHAVLHVRFTPFSPCLIAIQAAAELAMVRGTVKGGTGWFRNLRSADDSN